MKLLFRQLKGSEQTLEFEDSVPVSSVKSAISDSFNIPVSNLKLLLKGRILKETDTVSSAGVKEGDKITVVGQPIKTANFNQQLQRVLARHVGDEKAGQIRAQFEQILEKRLGQLSIDDLERIICRLQMQKTSKLQ